MDELSPTSEHLNDPYVLQLIQTISRMEDRIEELEEGSCRFNCATRKQAFMAGWHRFAAQAKLFNTNKEIESAGQGAYKKWQRELSETE